MTLWLYQKWTLEDLLRKCKSDIPVLFKQICAHLVVSGSVRDEFVVSKVVEFFGSSKGFKDEACRFLSGIDFSLVSSSFPFNTLISSYARSTSPETALYIYKHLVGNGFVPDAYTFPVLLKPISKLLGIIEGRQVHGLAVRMGFLGDLYVANSLLHFYGVCGDRVNASRVFNEMTERDSVSWTCLMSALVTAGFLEEALNLFLEMDLVPYEATFVSLLTACGRLKNVNMGKGIHGKIIKGSCSSCLVVSNALMDMYVKCECLGEVKQLFCELPERDVISWTTVISALVQYNRPKEAIEMFNAVLVSGVEPDKIILTSLLSACASIGALDYGRCIHEFIKRKGIRCDIHMGTTMVDMYAKCGCIETALFTFMNMSSKNVYTWNTLINGLAMHGQGHEALKQFDLMLRSGITPNEVTFLAILTACCHSGFVDVGYEYFCEMRSYNLSPTLEHFGSMIDMFCRAGLLDEAAELINSMPMPPDVLIWGAILTACRANENYGLFQRMLGCLLENESQDSGVYVLLSNIYASNERWNDVKTMRNLMIDKGIRKSTGLSVIEVSGIFHEFIVGATNHPQDEDIRALLHILDTQVRLEGSLPYPISLI